MFNRIYALPSWSVTEADRDNYIISEDEMADKAQQGNIIAITLLHEDYGVIDYDRHNSDEGMQKYQEHRAKYPDFFNNTRIERTPRDGVHVYFNAVGSLPGKPWTEVDVFDGEKHHWVAIPPGTKMVDGKRLPYVLEQDMPVQDLPAELLTEMRAGTPKAKKSLETMGIDLSGSWKPKLVKGQAAPKVYTYYRTQSSKGRVDVICDSDCGPFYRRTDGEWPTVTRHGEIYRVVRERIQPLIMANRIIGPAELNKAFTDVSYLNDLWQCPNCGRKYANDDAIVKDIGRIISSLPGAPRFWTTNMESTPQEVLVKDFFYVAPHETIIAGPKGKGKSHLAAHMAKMFIRETGKNVLWLTLDESADSVNQKVPEAVVFSSKNNLGTLSEYVFEDEVNVEQVLERALESVDFTDGLLIIEPWTFFYKGLSSAQDDYIKSYEAMAVLKRIAPGFHTILCGHTSKGQAEDRGAEAILGTTGLAGSTRFGWNVNMDLHGQRYVSAWGNDQTQGLRFAPIIDENGYRLEPFEKVDIKQAIAELLIVGQAESSPLLLEILRNEYPMVRFKEVAGRITVVRSTSWDEYLEEDAA